ncbi:uncharacterized protein LOC143238369 [Tachypleus tridentatus]|uniref:uncharacterized protein LOC143238369 n=1 Tax=Tachypleus tridentatus TaxID=6853 RepID=UPI003FD4E21C
MGNVPSEYYGEKCSKCGKQLQAVTQWNDFQKEVLKQREVYVFLKDKYYRYVGNDDYSCHDCFWGSFYSKDRETFLKGLAVFTQQLSNECNITLSNQQSQTMKLYRRVNLGNRMNLYSFEGKPVFLKFVSSATWLFCSNVSEALGAKNCEEIQRVPLEICVPIGHDMACYIQVLCSESQNQTWLKLDKTLYLTSLENRDLFEVSLSSVKGRFYLQSIISKQWLTLETEKKEVFGTEVYCERTPLEFVISETTDLLAFTINSQDSLFSETITPKQCFKLFNLWSVNSKFVINTIENLSLTQYSEFAAAFHELLFEYWPLKELLPNQTCLAYLIEYFTSHYCFQVCLENYSLDRHIDIFVNSLSNLFNSVKSFPDCVHLLQTLFQVCIGSDSTWERNALGIEIEFENCSPLSQFLIQLLDVSKAFNSCIHNKSWQNNTFRALMDIHQSIIGFSVCEILFTFVSNKIWSLKMTFDVFNVICKRCQQETHFVNELTQLEETLKIIRAFRIFTDSTKQEALTMFRLMDPHEMFEEVQKMTYEETSQTYKEIIKEMLRQNHKKRDTIPDGKINKIIKTFVDKLATESGNVDKEQTNPKSCIKSDTQIVDTEAENETLVSILLKLYHVVFESQGFYPAPNQILSFILMAFAKTGCFLQVTTGEGKSCIVAMFAAYLALRGKTVDIITSSPVLAQRDAEQWRAFYNLLDLTSDHNIEGMSNTSRVEAYECNIVYGTSSSFSADILRQEFELKEVRGQRKFDVLIADEIDFMLVDSGLQLTHLTQLTPGSVHLEPILALVWSFVSHYSEIVTDEGESFLVSKPQPFYVAVYSCIKLDNIVSPITLMEVVNEMDHCDFVNQGLLAIQKGGENSDVENWLNSLKVSDVITFLHYLEQKFHYSFAIFTQGNEQIKCLDTGPIQPQRVVICILVLENGHCQVMYKSQEQLSQIIRMEIEKHLEFGQESDENTLELPNYFETIVRNRLSFWIENGFLASRMTEDREYVLQEGRVYPVDYTSTGVIESNKHWGDGLQQLLEIKHGLRLSPMADVTNFMSNITLVKRYKKALFGVTGTLGTKVDKQFLKEQYGVDYFHIPTNKPSKLFELEGLVFNTTDVWINGICEVLKKELFPDTLGRFRRASLVVSEDIVTANKLYNAIKLNVTKNVRSYMKANDLDKNSIVEELNIGEVLVATNLACRGADVKVTPEVNKNGGLFVLVAYLPTNKRVERQAFGRTCRKGQAGSVQLIVNVESLPTSLMQFSDINLLKRKRSELERKRLQITKQTEMKEVLLKEELFALHCKALHDLCKRINEGEIKEVIASSLNEKWAFWLVANEVNVQKLKRNSLIADLETKIKGMKGSIESEKFLVENIYYIIKQGNESLQKLQYEEATKFYTDAINKEPDWATTAYYNRALTYIQLKKANYIQKSKRDLEMALKTLQKYKTEVEVTYNSLSSLCKINSGNDAESDLTTQLFARCQVINYFIKNIRENIKYLDKIKNESTHKSPLLIQSVFSLDPTRDEKTSDALLEFLRMGLPVVFSMEKKIRFSWECRIVLLTGLTQFAVCFAYLYASQGMCRKTIITELITSGISDIIDVISNTDAGVEIDMREWVKSKAWKIVLSVMSTLSSSISGTKSKGNFKEIAKLLKAVMSSVLKIPVAKLVDIFRQNLKEIVCNTIYKNVYQSRELQRLSLISTFHNSFSWEDSKQEILEGLRRIASSSCKYLDLNTNINSVVVMLIDSCRGQLEADLVERLKNVCLGVFRKSFESPDNCVDALYNTVEDYNRRIVRSLRDLDNEYEIQMSTNEDLSRNRCILNDFGAILVEEFVDNVVSVIDIRLSKFLTNYVHFIMNNKFGKTRLKSYNPSALEGWPSLL